MLTDSQRHMLAQDETQLGASGRGQITAPAAVPEAGDGGRRVRA